MSTNYYLKPYKCLQPLTPEKTDFREGSPYGIVVDMLDCDIVISKFEHQLCDCIHFWTNAIQKDMKSVILPIHESNSATTVLLEGWL